MSFFIAFLLALLSGMGVGGGGLFALYLKIFENYSQLEVQTFNLIFFLFASSAALTVHLIKRKIYFLPVCIAAASGIVGSLIGSRIALSVNTIFLSKLFGVMLVATGAYSLFRKKRG